MKTSNKYYKWEKCGLNYVTKQGDICSVCARDTNRGILRPFPHRQSGCYACKSPLDSFHNRICPKCGLMICKNCGACGCIATNKENGEN